MKCQSVRYQDVCKNILNVGVELEGGVRYSVLDELVEHFDEKRLLIDRDGSVRVPPPSGVPLHKWHTCAEVRYWSEDIGELLSFVKFLFDHGFRQNDTCGNHHHFVFKNHFLAVTALAQPHIIDEFTSLYTEYAQRKGEKYIARLTNSYCKAPQNDAEKRRSIGALDRYVSLNFCSTIKHEKSRTFEVRILPYADNYIEFVQMHAWLVKTIDKLVTRALQTLPPLEATITLKV